MGLIDDTLGTNIFGPNSTDRALNAQRRGMDQATQVQREMYDQQRQDFAPWRETGVGAMGQLNDNKFMQNWQQDPGYQFRLQQGQKALEQSAAARGGLNSGATLKALTRYGQDFGANEYQNVYNREYGRLSQLAGLGQASTAGSAAAAGNFGQSMANNYTGMANAAASAHIAQGNRGANLLGQGLMAGGMYFGGAKK